jgi:large subunit ribosomal protein L14
MIQERSILKIADNSGVKVVRCFRILGGTRKRYARLGEIIIASVQAAEPRKSFKKKDIVHALIIRTSAPLRREDGSYIRFDENAAVIVDKGEPVATRIFGPVPQELKERGYDKVVSLAQEIV